MGLDLRLLPLDRDTAEAGFAHSVLSVERSGDLFMRIRGSFAVIAPTTELPRSFTSFLGRQKGVGGHGYGETKTDPYGQRILCSTAGELSKLWTHEGVQGHARNRAVWEYLAALEPSTRVALYWH